MSSSIRQTLSACSPQPQPRSTKLSATTKSSASINISSANKSRLEQQQHHHHNHHHRSKVTTRTSAKYQRPRGSLSSCSSSSPDLSGTEEAEYYCNHYYLDERAHSSGYSLSVFDDGDEDDHENDNAPQNVKRQNCTIVQAQLNGERELDIQPSGRRLPVEPVKVPVAANRASLEAKFNQQQQQQQFKRRPRQMHHTRSISLIVNPNFGSSSSTDEDDETGSGSDKTGVNNNQIKNHKLIVACEQVESSPARPEAEQMKAGAAVAREQLVSADYSNQKTLISDDKLASSLLATHHVDDDGDARLTQDESVRLREIGFILRQISDEFARNRRLTI